VAVQEGMQCVADIDQEVFPLNIFLCFLMTEW
jgi:hypothetical protein